MTWVRLDDQFSIHRKLAGASDRAFRLHVSALCWSARNLTDGYIGDDELTDIWPRLRTPLRYAAELVDRNVWHLGATPCPAEMCPPPVDNGWRIHEYLFFQQSKDAVIHKRNVRSEAGRRGGLASGVSRSTSRNGTNPGSKTEANSFDFASLPVEPRPGPNPGVVVDVVNRTNGSSRARDPAVIDAIIKEILDQTGTLISPDWADKVAAELLTGQPVTNPAAYVRTCIRNEPNAAARFLPHAAYGSWDAFTRPEPT